MVQNEPPRMGTTLRSRAVFLVAITAFCGVLAMSALQARAAGDPGSVWVPRLAYAVFTEAIFVVMGVGKTLEGEARGDGQLRLWEWLGLAVLVAWVIAGIAMFTTGYTTIPVIAFTAMGAVGVAGALLLRRPRLTPLASS